MKKILAIVLILAAGMALQSCGGAEKCPAYTSLESPQEVKA